MKNKIITIVVLSLFFFYSQQAAYAASLQFSPASGTSVQGNTFQVSVLVNAGSDEVSSTDAYVLYDPAILQFQSFQAGNFFPYVVHNPVPAGKISIRGIVEDAATSRTGSGTLGTITFKALSATASSATLTFFCDLNASDTSKIVKSDLNATNLIVCTQNNSYISTISSPTPTKPAGSITPTISGGAVLTPTGGNTNPNNPNSGANGGNSGSAGGGNNSQGGPGTGGNANIGGNVTPPSSLPRSGGLDNIRRFAVAGSVLFIMGGLASLVL